MVDRSPTLTASIYVICMYVCPYVSKHPYPDNNSAFVFEKYTNVRMSGSFCTYFINFK